MDISEQSVAKGNARVGSKEYQENWDKIFNKKLCQSTKQKAAINGVVTAKSIEVKGLELKRPNRAGQPMPMDIKENS
jgi:hypothetical protein